MNKKPKTALFFLYHIKESIEAIAVHIQEGKQSFLTNRTVQMAVLRELEIIGEATNKLPDDLKNHYSSIPWRDIIDLRNILAHHYWAIELETVWNIIQNSDQLTNLKNQVEICIQELSTGEKI
ncbi:MAG: HepT-like ribonuclease domain-containing protein [Microcoleaceae cyanobacterium]